MREIKFRGISQYSGKMIYGQLLRGDNNFSIVIDFGMISTIQLEPIIKGTQSQYTGLKDKNGREIYEGDILQTDYYPCSVEDDYVLVIEYDIDRFWCVRKLKANANARGVSDGIADGLYEFLDHGLKVIGNIYENKELLEEK